MSTPLHDFVLRRSAELQKRAHPISPDMLRSAEMVEFSQRDLDIVSDTLQNLDFGKVSHVIPLCPEPLHVYTDTYGGGLSRDEAELLNKVAMADRVGRTLVHDGVGADQLRRALGKDA